MHTWITPQSIDRVIQTLMAALESASLLHTIPTGFRDRSPNAVSGLSGHHILEILRPEWFEEVSDIDPRAAIGLPLRIHLHVAEGQTHITYRTARESMEPYPSPALASWAQAIDHDLHKILSAIAQGI